MNDTHIVQLEMDPETLDLILPIPEEILQQTGWGLNDTLKITQNNDGTLTLERIDNA